MRKSRLILCIVAFLFLLVACSQPTETVGSLGESEQAAQANVASEAAPPNTPEPTKPSPTAVPAPTEAPLVRTATNNQEVNEVGSDRIVRITVASANLRSGPGLGFETIGVVLFNDAFEVIAEDELSLWYKIELADGDVGWVAASVTEDVSPEVYEALVATPEADAPADVEDVTDEEPEEAPEVVEEAVAESDPVVVADAPFAIQIDTSVTGVYSEPSLSSTALAFVARDEVYLVNGISTDGNWVFITLADETQGWVRLSRTASLDEEAVAAVAVDLEEGQTGPIEIASTAESDGAPEAEEAVASSGSSVSTGSSGGGTAIASTGATISSGGANTAAVSGSFGRTRIRPGSPLYMDTDNSGYGMRVAIAPSGPTGVIGSYNVPTKPQVAEGWDESEVYSQPLPRIMMLGDQFTAGTTPIANSYRRYLYNLLTSRDFAFDFVGTTTSYTSPMDFDSDHEGHVYYRADQILAGAWGWTSYDAPDYVLMLMGINDILQGQSAESTGQDVQLIINTLRYLNPNVKIILSHLPYTADPVINKEIDLVNMQFNRLSYINNTGNSPIYIISQWDIDPATDTYDGLHLNASGAQKMAQHFYYGLDHFWLVQTKTSGE